MNEQTTKKREWVKNAAIIFLIIMLLLTFFSNTIMNYSLPEIATQYVQSGTINEKIRANGSLVAAQEYNVIIGESRVIDQVYFKVGDKVNKDDVLFSLEDTDSTELKDAQKTLDDLEKDYQIALLSANPAYASDSLDIKNLKEDMADILDIDGNLKKVDDAKDTLQTLDQEKQNLDDQNSSIDTQIACLSGEDFTSLDKADYDKLQSIVKKIATQTKEVEEKKSTLDDVTSKMSSGTDAGTIADMRKSLEELQNSLSDYYAKLAIASDADKADIMSSISQAQIDIKYKNEEISRAVNSTPDSYRSQYLSAKSLYDNSNGTLTAYNDSLNKAKQSIKQSLEAKQKEIAKQSSDLDVKKEDAQAVYDELTQKYGKSRSEAEDKLKEAERNLEGKLAAYAISSGTTDINLKSSAEDIERQKEVVEKLKEKTTSAEVKTKMSGVIKSIDVTAGATVEANTNLAVIDVNDSGYTFEYTLTKQQAKKIKVGDNAEVEYFWDGNAEATVSKIIPDPSNPGQSSIVTFAVTGDVSSGQTINVSVGGKSQNYDIVIPKSALRDDSSGKFVYVINSRSSPLGNRYYAEKVKVEVLASDDTQVAVSGLAGNEYILTTSNKPVDNGTQVRLTNES